MTDIIVKDVDFYSGQILGVKTPDGKIYMGVRRACIDIGLTENQADRQVKNIQADLVLSKGSSILPLPTKGGEQMALGIEKDFIPLWLAKISITPAMQIENPDTVERLVKYQLEAKDVLATALMDKPKEPSCIEDLIIMQATAMKELRESVTQMSVAVENVNNRLDNVKDAIVTNRDNHWRDEVNRLLNEVARKNGGQFQEYRRMSYISLSARARCDLEVRLKNMRDRLSKQGYSKTAQSNINKLDVIEADAKLKEIYNSIVREMYVKYVV